jgi:phosphonoacetaldehyde hydrolase
MVHSPRLSERFDLVIFDWAGTIVDFGCCAPLVALQQAFGRHGVSLTHAEIRRDMGKAKADHVGALLTNARIAAAWKSANGATPTSRDCDALMADLAPLMREQAELAATLIDGARETVDTLRAAGLRVGSSTGYTRAMMEPVLKCAASQGYVPDHLVCSGETPQGRPSPLMIYKACVELAVWPTSRVVKVDDSEVGVAEGRAAGCLTVGLSASGNSVGLSAAELAALPAAARRSLVASAERALRAAGADIVLESVATLVPALEQYMDQHTAR